MGDTTTLLRTPTGLSDRLNDDDELDAFNQWRHGPGGQMHKAVGAESHWDKQRMVFTTRKPYHDLQDVLLECSKAGVTVDFDTSNCTWADVIRQMEKAQNTYKAKADKNRIRAVFRRGQRISTAMETWLDVIPDQFGLNVLHAGLALIFQAIQERAQTSEKVFQTFKLIPEMMDKVREMRQIHPKEEGLRDSTIDFHKTLFEEMPVLIRVLLRERHGSFFKHFGDQVPSQGRSLVDTCIGKVEKAYADLKNCLDNISHKKLAGIDQNVSNTARETQAIRQTAVSTHIQVGSVSKDLHAVGQNLHAHREESITKFEGVENKVESTGDGVKNHITRNLNEKGEEIKGGLAVIEDKLAGIDKKFDRLEEWKTQFGASRNKTVQNANPEFVNTIQSGIYYIVLETVYYRETVQPQTRQDPSPSYQKVTPAELLRILNVPVDAANKDLGHVLQQSSNLKTDNLAQGRWLMTTTEFKNWLAGRSSDILLVDGHCDQANAGKISPMSVFCATLAATVVKLQWTIVLNFFCGQHVAFHDPLRGPNGLLRSLICQLLLSPNTLEPNLEILDQQEIYNELHRHDLHTLLHLFQELVRQIPQGTLIFCIIDGLSEYETRMENSAENLRSVIQGLQSILHDQVGPIIKVLMTSAHRSTDIVKQIPAEQCVSLRAGNMLGRPLSEPAFLAEIAKGKVSMETPWPAVQGLPWEPNQAAQIAGKMSTRRIEGPPPNAVLWPWLGPEHSQALVGADRSLAPAPQTRTNMPTRPPDYGDRYY